MKVNLLLRGHSTPYDNNNKLIYLNKEYGNNGCLLLRFVISCQEPWVGTVLDHPKSHPKT